MNATGQNSPALETIAVVVRVLTVAWFFAAGIMAKPRFHNESLIILSSPLQSQPWRPRCRAELRGSATALADPHLLWGMRGNKCPLAGGARIRLFRSMPKPAPVLPAIGILESLGEEARAALAAAGEVSSLPEGAYLVKQGDQQERLYLLLDGKLSASCRSDNSIVELGMIMPGESVGEMNVIDPRKASADVKAVRASRVWSISQAALEVFMEANPETGMKLMRALAGLLCRRIRKGSDRMLRQAEMAYAVYEWLD